MTPSCTHGSGRRICRLCLQRHVKAQLSSWPHNRVHCWVPSCGALLNHNDIRRCAAPGDFERYDQLLLHQVMDAADGSYKRCTYVGCNGGGWCDPKTTSFVMCQSCQRSTCVDCDTTPYHSGQPCANSPQAKRRRREDEDATVAMVMRISKPCPNEECRARIEKIEGCDHMTCTRFLSRFSLFSDTDLSPNFHRQEVPTPVLLDLFAALWTHSSSWQFETCRRLQVQESIKRESRY